MTAWLGMVAIPAMFAVLPTTIIVLKNSVTEQTRPEAVEPAAAAFGIEVSLAEPAPLAQASFSKGSISGQLIRDDAFNLSFFEEFADFAALESKYTAGTYSLTFSGGVNGTYPFSLQTGLQPSMPRITNLTSLQSITQPDSVLIQWERNDAQVDDIAFLIIVDASENTVYESPLPEEPGALNGFSTEVRIPLPAGQLLTGILNILRINDLEFYNSLQTSVGTGQSASVTFPIDTRINQNIPPRILSGPIDQNLEVGQSFILSVTLNEDAGLPIAYQWYCGDAPVQDGDADDATFTVIRSSLADAGDYKVLVSNSAGNALSPTARITINPRPAPTITQQPMDLHLLGGQTAILGVLLDRTDGVTYQWQRNGVPIAGATHSSIDLTQGGPLDVTGDFNVVISWDGQSIVSGTARLTSDPGVTGPLPAEERLTNLSLRARVENGSNGLIVGFVLGGDSPKRMLIRAVGPGLERFGIHPVLQDPVLDLRQNNTRLTSNNDFAQYMDQTEINTITDSFGAFPLLPESRDAVLLSTISPGVYTARIRSNDETTGVALAELFEGDRYGTVLQNLSARAHVGAGADVLIPGFVTRGSKPQTFLIRAVGPGLDAYGVKGFLADPRISLRNNQPDPLAANDNWQDGPDPAAIASVAQRVGAFALGSGSLDAALLVTLEPGVYTVVASGVGATTGIALVEVYAVPEE